FAGMMSEATARVREVAQGYEPSGDRPLGGYIALLGIYGALTGASALAVRSLRRELPARIEPADIALLAVATHKLSRLLTKDPVTSPFRAPLTAFEGQSGPAEVGERPRRRGFLHAAGELVTCPFCVGQWVATAFMTGLLLAPRLTRVVAAGMTVVAAADALNLGYNAAQQRAG
ncbi:MAG: DUF1360 domain-containing protein, partial [Planctomycetaceae bacterium]|nr:DUF1360 domain-containing protein [Planctomycetaceae bacterium]